MPPRGPYHPKPEGWEPDGDPKHCQAWATSKGAQCGNAPMHGQRVCRKHGGASGHQRRAGARRVAEQKARNEIGRLGRWEAGVDPLAALVELVSEWAGNVAVYRYLIQQLEHEYRRQPITDKDEVLVGALGTGIAGPNHLGDGAPHVFVVQYEKACDRLAHYSKLALDAGVQERQVQLAEQHADMIITVIMATLEHFGLDHRGEVAPIVARQLRLVAGGAEDTEHGNGARAIGA